MKLKKFRGVEGENLVRLASVGAKNAGQMLAAGCTPKARAELSQRTGIPEDVLLDLARLSDLARLPGAKGIRASLYFLDGVDSVQVMAAWEPEPLRPRTTFRERLKNRYVLDFRNFGEEKRL